MNITRLRRIALAATVAVLTPLSVLSVLAALGAARRLPADPVPVAAPAVGTALRRPRPVPTLRLVNERGQPFAVNAWRGRWVVLASAMTLCHEVCPLTTGALIGLESDLRRVSLARRVVVAEVTVDPWRDIPSRLRAYRRLTGADFELLTGSPAQIRRFWNFFGVYYRQLAPGQPPALDWLTHRPEAFDVQHTDGLFFIDPSGRERIIDAGMPDVAGHFSPALRSLLSAQGRTDLAHPQLPWSAGQVLDDLRGLMGRDATNAPVSVPSGDAARRALSGSPRALAAVHAQAGALLGGEPALAARIAALRGYPIVLSAWASWCGPCRSEFPIFAAAAARYGRRVAFLAVDTNDAPGSGRAFLAAHPISYPSYQSSSGQLASLGVLEGLPTTIFINRAGQVTSVHTGQYGTLATLAHDVGRLTADLRTGSHVR